jgi:outer membrane receptor protein involved in Fe transport
MGTFSASYYGVDSLDPNSIQKHYVKWDAGIAISSQDDKWRLSLQGRNLSNKYVHLYVYDAANMQPRTYVSVPQRGRQVALEASYRF